MIYVISLVVTSENIMGMNNMLSKAVFTVSGDRRYAFELVRTGLMSMKHGLQRIGCEIRKVSVHMSITRIDLGGASVSTYEFRMKGLRDNLRLED